MSRATSILAATTVAGIAASVWLFLDNRSLRDELAERPLPVVAEAPPPVAKPVVDTTAPKPAAPLTSVGERPTLPATKEETRMERRQRRMEEFANTFGRLEGETDEEYKARVMPMVSLGLATQRMKLAEMRRVAEEKAKITPAQSAELDKAFAKVYDEAIDYTNKAITDGQLSPYERNVAGWLDYAGGLGGILTTANGQIGKILDPGQVKAMADAGFEWGEYLGVNAPWENLKPPPPRPK
jgi:hypothetical protein